MIVIGTKGIKILGKFFPLQPRRWQILQPLFVALLAINPGLNAEARPGSQVFEEQCASCHDRVGAHAPAKKILQALPTANIVRSLESGVMRIIGTLPVKPTILIGMPTQR